MSSTLIPQPTVPGVTEGTAFALIAEFEDVESIAAAAEKVRDAGFEKWDVHSPFPIHGINHRMGLRPTILPWIAAAHGLVGLLAGLALVWWMNAHTISGIPTMLQGYEFLISGKPMFSLTANIAVIFETTILFAAIGTLLGMLGLNKLPMLSNPLLKSRRFRRVTSDRFFLVIETSDRMFHPVETVRFVELLGARSVETVMD